MHSPLLLPPEVITIAETIARQGGQAVLVGGSVRDHFLGQPTPKDLDIEVYRITPALWRNFYSLLEKFMPLEKVLVS